MLFVHEDSLHACMVAVTSVQYINISLFLARHQLPASTKISYWTVIGTIYKKIFLFPHLFAASTTAINGPNRGRQRWRDQRASIPGYSAGSDKGYPAEPQHVGRGAGEGIRR